MKLKNKKTGEIRELPDGFFCIYNLNKLCEEWEEYNEPTGYWYIDFDGEILGCVEPFDDETEENRKAIGNYFETKEEAEKAVEKLKAWKRLKDNGIITDKIEICEDDFVVKFKLTNHFQYVQSMHDFDYIFGLYRYRDEE